MECTDHIELRMLGWLRAPEKALPSCQQFYSASKRISQVQLIQYKSPATSAEQCQGLVELAVPQYIQCTHSAAAGPMRNPSLHAGTHAVHSVQKCHASNQ